jgi:hypothetical protein
MESNRDVFLRLSENSFLELEEKSRCFLQQFRVDEEKGDFSENLKDEVFSSLYKMHKKIKKDMAEREFQLREVRRKKINK